MKRKVMASAAPSYESDEPENLASSTSPITTLHPDIIQTHILTRLDGATLAAAYSVSSELRHLCTNEELWRNVCTATWPSLADPIANHVISTFPGGYRSIFSNAFPCLHHHLPSPTNQHRDCANPPSAESIIFTVDIYCQGKPLFSRVQCIQTQSYNYLRLSFHMDVLVPTTVTYEEWLKYLQENITLSWILIDPTRKCAANLSSWKPVSVKRSSDYLNLVYAVVMAGKQQGSAAEMVQCKVEVSCWGKVGGELHMTGMRMVLEDMDGIPLWGWESMMILERAIENGERKKVNEVRAKERFENFSCKMKERIEISKALFPAEGNIRHFKRWFFRKCLNLKYQKWAEEWSESKGEDRDQQSTVCRCRQYSMF